MFDWTAITKDPSDRPAGLRFQAFLKSILSFYGVSRNDFLRNYFGGKRVMDIGAGEHNAALYNPEKWEHGIICKVAAYAMGVDINPEVCEHYNKAGYNFKCVDATSDTDLGERFDCVFMGDVIEHVNNPVALVQFAKRHLTPGQGRILLSTPNPFCFSFLSSRWRKKDLPFFIANFEHMSWVSATNANEIARRSGMTFTKIYFPRPPVTSFKTLVARCWMALGLPELAHKEYIYEFTA